MTTQRSYPILESRDDPNALPPADVATHLQAHVLLDEQLRSFETRLRVLEMERHDSEPVTFERTKDRLVVRAKGAYAVALSFVALIAFGAWLWMR